MAGAALAGVYEFDVKLLVLIVSMSLSYLGGMFLNDAYDRRIDAVERPRRPIPAGEIKALTVFVLGYAMLAGSIALVLFCAHYSTGFPLYAAICVACLTLCIILYNLWHKTNPYSPFIMGLCRMFVYITTAYALLPDPSSLIFVAAFITLCYLIGLTYIAKSENNNYFSAIWTIMFLAAPLGYGLLYSTDSFPTFLYTLALGIWLLYSLQFLIVTQKRDVPKAVVHLIAGISLVDAIYISSIGYHQFALLPVVAFLLTLFLQRHISGT